MPIRILIVDAYSLVREGLRMFLVRDLDFEIVGEAANGKEAIEQASWLHPNLIVIDLMLPGQDGIRTIAALHQNFPFTPIVVLSSELEQATVSTALRAGASSYLAKDIRASDLRTALKAATAGQVQFSLAPSASVVEAVQPSKLRQSHTGC